MTDDERAALEAEADRCRRRGAFAEAVDRYRQLTEAFPENAIFPQKLAGVTESLQPLELQHPKAAAAASHAAPSPLSTSEEEGERRALAGDLRGALTAYREALRARPDNALVQERLAQLFEQLRAAPPPPIAAAPECTTEETLQTLLERLRERRRPTPSEHPS